MVRNIDYQARKKTILGRAVSKYIKDAQAVASDGLAREFDLSSATIRNIFSELEEDGYLRHPYTSGGRIPTDKGYRYYVDFLISQMPAGEAGQALLDEEKARISKGYSKELKRLEDILEQASEMISAITRSASIVSFLEWEGKLFYKGISFILEQPEFQDYETIRLLIKMIEDKQRLLNIVNREFKEKVKVYIGEELGCREMNNCALVVSSYRAKKHSPGRLAILGPMRMEYAHIIPALEYAADVLTEVLDEV